MNEKNRKIDDEIKVTKHNALLEAPIVDSSFFSFCERIFHEREGTS